MSSNASTPRIDGCELVGLTVESVLYGIFIVLLVQSIDALAERSRARHEGFLLRPLTVTALLLFITISGHWVLDVSRAFEAFIYAQDNAVCDAPENPATLVYEDLAEGKSVANSALYVITTLIGDVFMVYRLFIVWGRNYLIVIAPLAMCVALAVTGSMTTWLFSRANGPIFKSAGGWITASFVMTLCANLISTSLISMKIWITGRRYGGEQSHGVQKVMEIIVESAVLYSCCVVISLGAYLADSNIQFVAVCINSPMVGIIFCMIVSRAHRFQTSSSGAAASHNSTPRRGRLSHRGSRYAMHPVAIKITTEVDGPSSPSLRDENTPHRSDFDPKGTLLSPLPSPTFAPGASV